MNQYQRIIAEMECGVPIAVTYQGVNAKHKAAVLWRGLDKTLRDAGIRDEFTLAFKQEENCTIVIIGCHH